MYEASQKFGGEGGGHDIAAGATIPEDKVDEFMDLMDSGIEKQLE